MADEDTKDPQTLLEAENQEHLSRKELKLQKLARVAKGIEELLIADDLTWGEWGEIVEMYSARIGHFVTQIKINPPK